MTAQGLLPTTATQGLLVVIAAFWVATLACGGPEFTPALVRLGAQVRASGEPWRMWSYAFLHGSWAHVFMNGFALWRIGQPLERLLGTQRFVTLYSLTALAGGVATSFTSAGLSVGSSGALWGLLGAEAILVLGPRPTLPPPLARRARGAVAQNLILNVVISFLPGINAAAHFAGGAIGMLLMLTVLAPGLPTWGDDGVRPGEPPDWLQPLAWLTGSALLASAAIAVVTGRPWALAAPGPTVEAQLAAGRIAVPAQLAPRTPDPAKDTVVFGNLLSDPAVVLASGIPLEPAELEEAREHPELLLAQPEATRTIDPPTSMRRDGRTLATARYVHKTGDLWESALVLMPDGDHGAPAEMLRIDAVLHARASQAWHGLATEIAASATPNNGAGRH